MNADDRPLFERLEVLIDDHPHHGHYNMALDEVLLCSALGLPLLRLYQWIVPTVSFGYFEPWQRVAEQYSSREMVRRWTGGGIVDHQHDWSYSLLLPRCERITNLPAGESYRLIHTKLREAMTKLGLAGVVIHGASSESSHDDSHACFAKPVEHDLMIANRKVSGAAQRRTRQGLLHQGSVQTVPGNGPELSGLATMLPSVLARETFGRTLSPDHDAAAHQLAQTKYASDAWLRRA